jgi:vitamin B12 transporter
MKSILAFFLVFSPFFAFSQTTQTASDEIVVTASAIPETVESTPATVTVITKKEIEQHAARDLADVLREVPGLTISRTGSPGKATSLFTRGANSTHTLVLWNGIEINNPYFAGYDWGRFSTAGVQQVEVVRGPYSALYGSDAVAGVVNVLTNPVKSGVRGDFELGGHGLRNAMAGADYVTPSTLFSASYEHRNDDGFDPNDDFAQNTANLFWKWTASNHFSIGVAGRRTAYDLGIPTNLNFDGTELVPSPNRRQEGTERQIAIPIAQSIGRFSYEIALSESRRNDDFTDPDDPYGYVNGTTDSITRRARLTTRTSTALGTIVAGGEYERATVTDVTTFGSNLDHDRRRDKSFFIEDRIEHELGTGSRLEMSLGARRDDFDEFGSETSPRVAFAWIVGSNKVHAAYGQSFRAPSIGELFFPFSGNASLQPEHGKSTEIGYDHALGDKGLFSIILFHARYRDLIVFDNVTYTFANIGRARTQGAEISLTRNVGQSYYSSMNYTYLDTKQDDTGEELLRRPKHSGSIFIGRRAGKTDTNIALVHTGSRLDVLPVAPFSHVSDKAHTTVDVNVQMHGDRYTPYIKLENATNERYEEVRGYRSPGRRLIFGLRVGV